MSTWATASPSAASYSHYFTQPRPLPPPNTCMSATMSHQSNGVSGDATTTITFHDASTLTHTLNGQTLDLNFVQDVLSSTTPLFRPSALIDWQWTDWPEHIAPVADAEQAYYPWLQWVVF
ncbi:hypothetical protein B0H17DRAFT_1190635 [Mycena rosella]|uniref:Uncharacterized protein n=1 Tax=Mycena rosella TaxID=1033263 RepID=A0AAD7H3K9_MYCRO|nr:hypothetical protein B0H17DRAFT_1190635 [Mycena rosella]